jgi:hypothetical protein
MDWMTTGGIILGIFGVTAILSLFMPRDRDPEVGRDHGDGPVIPVPGADGSVMGAGGRRNDPADDAHSDLGEVEDDHLDGPV